MSNWGIAFGAITALVGLASLVVLLLGVGKAWAGIAAAVSKMDALHRRLDTFQVRQEQIEKAVVEIRTVLRLHPTLRFRMQSTAGPDVFPPETGG